MNLGMSELIRSINLELIPEFHSGAYHWMDESREGAFERLTRAFEIALHRFTQGGILRAELDEAGRDYKDGMLKYFREYKAYRGMKDEVSFLAFLDTEFSGGSSSQAALRSAQEQLTESEPLPSDLPF